MAKKKNKKQSRFRSILNILVVFGVSGLLIWLFVFAERYLKIRFERRKVEGLVASYRGPKKLKSSGKAAGSKKKKTAPGKTAAKKTKARRPTGKPKNLGAGDGFDVIRKKR